jgi:3-methyladenine DNA glycosylase AlkD
MSAQPLHLSLPNGATTPQLRQLAKALAKAHNDLPASAFAQLITNLIHDPSPVRKTMGGILLGYMPIQRRQLSPALYDDWLDHTVGWATVDALCYGNISPDELLDNLTQWKTLCTRLIQSDNPNKRRGAIVLLTKAVKQSADVRLCGLAFDPIDTTSGENDILITKAVSWLLRNLTRYHAPAVRQYLNTHEETLPAIAIRETNNKLKHGTKSPPKRPNG